MQEKLENVCFHAIFMTLILGDRRMAKLKRFFAQRGIRLPSREKIKEKEQQLMVDYEINEAIGNKFSSIVF